MKLVINILFGIILVLILGLLSVYILTDSIPRRQKLQFGIKNITLNAENAINPEALKEPDNKQVTEKERKELEIAWGQWHADIHNALLVDYLGAKRTYCPDFSTKTDLMIVINKDKKITDRIIKIEPYCEELDQNINDGIDQLDGSNILTFPEKTKRDKNTYSVKLTLCNKLTNPSCGIRVTADKYPEIERYQAK